MPHTPGRIKPAAKDEASSHRVCVASLPARWPAAPLRRTAAQRQPDNASAKASLEPTLPIHIVDLSHRRQCRRSRPADGKGIGKGNSWPFFL
jgi:hypothetical protein